MQLRQHPPEGCLLLWCPGVRRLPMLIEAPLITDADGVTVMPITVRTYLRHGPSQFDAPISSDDEMIPNPLPGALCHLSISAAELCRPGGTAEQ